ncbi:hypothetical protein HNR60_001306 [Rhodopseudomonas rhenobacensis]|uniref:Uncharacterized protein n=1 Tax=Rhodopseudomonas rhenobacensis TaxID=87461 RepID=A0A7W7Z2A1_9BRAD|nr:hypothetical protein [Rhodopseudomonas rhenobacensis]MBB5046558.1 hypothetical protein [Rhodopseudomonas rhenobacensis]
MIQILDIDLAPLVTVAALLGLIAVISGRLCVRFRRRAAQLRTSAGLLRDHLTALQTFIDHPQSPSKMKEKLLIFSKVVSDRGAFMKVLEMVCNEPGRMGNSSEAKTYERQVAQLRAQNEELSRCFEIAVSTIVVAMMLRHQDASELVEARMAKMIADPRKEFAFFAGAIKADRAGNHGSKNSNGFGAEAALA